MGTGIYGSEYIVASKQLATPTSLWELGGAGLQAKATQNPLRAIDDRFTTRSANVGEGGELSVGNFSLALT